MGDEAKQPQLTRPCDIPIYGDLQVSAGKSVGKPLETKPSETYDAAVGGVREARLLAQSGWGQLEAFKEKVDHVINTGIAHSAATFDMVKDKDNVAAQAGFIGGSALFGYILGAFSRRARILKKLVYTGVLGGGAGYLCYPDEMTQAANYAYEEGNKLSLIAYNFVAGVQPNGSNQADQPKEDAAVLSDDDKKFLSETTSKDSPERDQSNPADVDMYTRRDDK